MKDRLANYKKRAKIHIPRSATSDFEFTIEDDETGEIEDDAYAVKSLLYFIFEEPENFKF